MENYLKIITENFLKSFMKNKLYRKFIEIHETYNNKKKYFFQNLLELYKKLFTNIQVSHRKINIYENITKPPSL